MERLFLFALSIPLIFLLSFLFAAFKKVKVYDVFVAGAGKAIPLIVSIFPYIAAVTILARLLSASGLEDKMLHFLSPRRDHGREARRCEELFRS